MRLRPTRRLLCTIALVIGAYVIAASCSTAAAAPAPSALRNAAAAARAPRADGWAWSSSARRWAASTRTLPPAVVAQGPAAPLTRGQFLAALVRVETARTARSGTAPLLSGRARIAPARPGAPANSVAARALALRWITPIAGNAALARPMTANEAALAVTGMLGLRGDVHGLAVRLKQEIPGVSGTTTWYAAQALARTVGLRYNVLDPHDALELGPNEPINVAHASYMLQAAATSVQPWRVEAARQLARTFELPELGPNQARILATGVRLLGQPYVWAGETEAMQPEGHGGFDCSGFTLRIINQSGIAPADLDPILERTTYTQSKVPARARISRAALEPGDAMFFASTGPRSAPADQYHAGVYMGNGWFIHSSGGNAGVAIDSLDGWWKSQFSWGRRALRQP